MAWSEEKRKKIWGKKFNPAVLLGIFFLLATLTAGLISFIIGLVFIYQGYRMYKKYG